MVNLKETESGVLDWRFSPSAMIESVRQGRSEDSWGMVSQLKIPTLWIRGENSIELNPETFQKILASNQLIHGVTIRRSGHWVHSENREDFVTELKKFADL